MKKIPYQDYRNPNIFSWDEFIVGHLPSCLFKAHLPTWTSDAGGGRKKEEEKRKTETLHFLTFWRQDISWNSTELKRLIKGNTNCSQKKNLPWNLMNNQYCSFIEFMNLKHWRFPWWSSGKESTCQYRGHGFDPWYRKTAHAKKQLGQCITSTESMLWNLWGTTTEACKPQSPCAEAKRSHCNE